MHLAPQSQSRKGRQGRQLAVGVMGMDEKGSLRSHGPGNNKEPAGLLAGTRYIDINISGPGRVRLMRF
jgi:hypothetical protein